MDDIPGSASRSRRLRAAAVKRNMFETARHGDDKKVAENLHLLVLLITDLVAMVRHQCWLSFAGWDPVSSQPLATTSGLHGEVNVCVTGRGPVSSNPSLRRRARMVILMFALLVGAQCHPNP